MERLVSKMRFDMMLSLFNFENFEDLFAVFYCVLYVIKGMWAVLNWRCRLTQIELS